MKRERNAHDGNTVAVYAAVKGKGSYCVGYLPRGLAAFIAPLLDCGKTVQSKFNRIKVCEQYLPYGLEIAIKA